MKIFQNLIQISRILPHSGAMDFLINKTSPFAVFDARWLSKKVNAFGVKKAQIPMPAQKSQDVANKPYFKGHMHMLPKPEESFSEKVAEQQKKIKLFLPLALVLAVLTVYTVWDEVELTKTEREQERRRRIGN